MDRNYSVYVDEETPKDIAILIGMFVVVGLPGVLGIFWAGRASSWLTPDMAWAFSYVVTLLSILAAYRISVEHVDWFGVEVGER